MYVICSTIRLTKVTVRIKKLLHFIAWPIRMELSAPEMICELKRFNDGALHEANFLKPQALKHSAIFLLRKNVDPTFLIFNATECLPSIRLLTISFFFCFVHKHTIKTVYRQST